MWTTADQLDHVKTLFTWMIIIDNLRKINAFTGLVFKATLEGNSGSRNYDLDSPPKADKHLFAGMTERGGWNDRGGKSLE